MSGSTIIRAEYSRDEFLRYVLFSREVTRVGQHLAIVLYFMSDTTANLAKLSLRDLSSITGWNPQTILNHLTEIQTLFQVTYGKGRAKTSFQMQAAITMHVNAARIERDARLGSGSSVPSVYQIDTRIDAKVDRQSSGYHVDAKIDTTIDTNSRVYQIDATVDTTVPLESSPIRDSLKGKEDSQEQLPLSELRSDDVGATKKRKAIKYTPSFSEFWENYPDRENNSKANAFKEWRKLSEDDHAMVLASMVQFASYCKKNTDWRVIHAERYLKHRKFEAHQGQPNKGSTKAPWWKQPEKLASMTLDRWRKGIAELANGMWPVDKLGPPPGSGRCVVPPELVDEMKLTQIYDDRGLKR